MKTLQIEVTDEQFEVIKKKFGDKIDLNLRLAIERFTNAHTVAEALPPIDLIGLAKRAMEAHENRLDPNRPTPPVREVKMTDEEWKDRLSGHEWQLNRYNKEQADIQRLRERGNTLLKPV